MNSSSQYQVLQVALPVPLLGCFDYLADTDIPLHANWIGCRVEVPFGARHLIGWVNGIGLSQMPGDSVKRIKRRIDPRPLVSPEFLNTVRWTARYYQAPLGEIFNTAVPAQIRDGHPFPELHEYAWRLQTPAAEQAYRARKNSALHKLLSMLTESPLTESKLAQTLPRWAHLCQQLSAQNVAERFIFSEQQTPLATVGPELNTAQHACVQAIRAQTGFAVHMLDGITGSGKTEIYIQALAHCLANNRQALVLVPEIGLTPQTLQRFSQRLAVPVQVLHSNLSDSARTRAWANIASAKQHVLLGTRSAVFTPLPKPGLIIIDEEHDASYKQQDGCHYHARDVAIMRAKALGIPIILGSATPSLESVHNTASGRYQAHYLNHRTGQAVPPHVRVVDIRKKPLTHGLSAELLAGVTACLARGEQALVFKNRRGYAPALLCHDCGFIAMCPRCDRSLSLHTGQKHLHCHHCGYQKLKPLACPDCGSLAMQAQGFGTERLEETLNQIFPDYPCIRIDSQSTRKRNGLQQQLNQLGQQAGILVGTQILAKGHDLAKLSFVGVVGVDEGLFSSDFRAAEKLAQLLIQVSGRAGRSDRAGHVLIQTHHPEHPLLTVLLHGGYRNYAHHALLERQEAQLPPYTFMALLRAEALQVSDVQDFLQAANQIFSAHTKRKQLPIHCSGVMPAPMPKRAGKIRWQLALNAEQRPALQGLLQATLHELYALKSARKVRWSIDVDPIDFY